MSAHLVLGQPVQIKGKKVLVIADEIGPVSKYQDGMMLEPSRPEHDFIWFREESLAALKRQHPGLPVYGLWQLLIASKVLDLAKQVHLFETGQESGQYLIVTDGRAELSGRYLSNQLPAQSGYQYSDGVICAPDLASLSLPKKPARLSKEILDAGRRVRTISIGSGLIGLASVIAGGYGIDQYLQARATAVKKQEALIRSTVVRIRAQIEDTKTQVYEFDESARQSTLAVLSRAAELADKASSQWTLNLVDNPAPMIEAKVDVVPSALSFPVEAAVQPGTQATLKFSADGSGDSNLDQKLTFENPTTQGLVRAAKGKE